jgi:hypothetical protein
MPNLNRHLINIVFYHVKYIAKFHMQIIQELLNWKPYMIVLVAERLRSPCFLSI